MLQQSTLAAAFVIRDIIKILLIKQEKYADIYKKLSEE